MADDPTGGSDTKGKTPADCITPTPSGEELPPGETEKIIASMLEILRSCQVKIDDQKIDSHSLVFMLLRIKESLKAYSCDYISKLDTFLCLADKITAEYYQHMACTLPYYGDYVTAVENEKSDSIDVGEGVVASKQDVLKLVNMVTDNYYAGAMFLKPGRHVLKDVNSCQSDRREIVQKLFTPVPKWMEFHERVTAQLEQIREQTFKISAYIDFLKQGEMKQSPKIDFGPLNPKPDQKKKPVVEPHDEKKDKPKPVVDPDVPLPSQENE